MIRIRYCRDSHCVTIEGHAGYSEIGAQDPVCAAVSALAYTLSANVMDLGEKGMVVNGVMRMHPGDSEISCKVVPGFEEDVERVFEAVCLGFELLSSVFEKNIQYEAVVG